MPDKVLIFDTTLRDGEQSPGASMNQEEKLSIARLLEELKVDIIEAGFPIASKGDFNSVQAIAHEIKDCQAFTARTAAARSCCLALLTASATACSSRSSA